jgi:hypothetical protein
MLKHRSLIQLITKEKNFLSFKLRWDQAISSATLVNFSFVFRHMSLHMQRQMIASGKRSLAYGTFEWLGSGVLTVVPRQFITPRESPLAFGPLTRIRFLT